MDEKNLIHFLSWLMIVSAVGVLLALTKFKQYAWYGRYSVANGGSSIAARWAWFFQESPALLIPLVIILGDCRMWNQKENFFALALFILHYCHRVLIYPFLIRGGKPTPLYIMALAGSFCCMNGYTQARYHCQYAFYGTGHITSPLSVIDMVLLLGIVLFITGFAINVHSDHILRKLRKSGETGYHIPRGGMFNYVSGANFFGEIVEWTGFTLYTRTLPSFAFAIFTAANVGPRAFQHHKFYKEKFEEYPQSRKALIPFLI